MMNMLRTIAELILPKDEINKLPPHVIYMSKDLARAINDDEPLAEPERFESSYYLLTQDIICKQCGYSMCIPFGKIPAELYVGCNGAKSCFHDFETVIDKGTFRFEFLGLEVPLKFRCEELTKTEKPYEGIVYFNGGWWKIKSGKSVYANHLDEIVDED